MQDNATLDLKPPPAIQAKRRVGRPTNAERAARKAAMMSATFSLTTAEVVPAPQTYAPPLDERLIRVNELAHRLSVERSTIFRWIKSGKLPKPIKVSRTLTYWRASTSAAWMQNPAGANL